MLVYSALFAKLRRIHKIMASAQSFRRVEVPRKSVAVTVFVFLALMVVILLTWQLVSPMTWERTVTATTFLTGFPTASFGRCTSEHSAVFAGISAGFIGVCLACSLFLSYKTRRISLEFAESKYVRNYSEHSSIKDIQILTVSISRGYRLRHLCFTYFNCWCLVYQSSSLRGKIPTPTSLSFLLSSSL